MTEKRIQLSMSPVKHQVYDPAKRYSYEWPGQPRKTVSGEELTELCKGAVTDMLGIREEGATDLQLPLERVDGDE